MGFERIKSCRCPCHVHPTIHASEPCNICGHYNSKGHMPGTLDQGWIECENDYCHIHTTKRIDELI